ncbi:retrotransposon protein, putative, ty1-copia subclass [Tanacetum coccineum]
MVRSMMNLTTFPLSFWDYALESVARILNMVPTKKVDKTPYELWFGKVPNLSYLKETMGYYFYFLPENKIVVAMYAEFFEKNLLSQEVSGRAGELEEIQDEDTSPSEITSEILMEVEDAMEMRDAITWNDNQVWRLVDLPLMVRCWKQMAFLRKRLDMVDNVHTYKARLVARDLLKPTGLIIEDVSHRC